MFLAALALAAPLAAQAPSQSPRTWTIEYERTIHRMHAEPIKFLEHARMTVRSVGDSLIGDLLIPMAGKDSVRYLIRGMPKAALWTLYVEEPKPQGLAILMVPVEAAMDWLRDAVHGVAPTVIRFDLTVKGDSVTGTRTVTGFPGNEPRVTAVRGSTRRQRPGATHD
jgi:hypothetical protein